jgi:hypothetical protein
MACAAALTVGVGLDFYGRPATWTPMWMLNMVLIVGGGIGGLVTLLRRPPAQSER